MLYILVAMRYMKDAIQKLNPEVTSSTSDTIPAQASILQIYDEYAFLWNTYDSSVFVVSQREHEFEQLRLVPTDTPLFQVNRLLISPSGKWICVSGEKGEDSLQLGAIYGACV